MHYIKRFLNHLFSEETLARICLILGIVFTVASLVTFLKMLLDLFGFQYLLMTMFEASIYWIGNFALGEVIPIDIDTIVWGIATILLASVGISFYENGSIIGNTTRGGAILIIILSFTPIPTSLRVFQNELY